VLVVTNAGVVSRAEEGITNTPFLPPLLLDAGVAPYGIQNAVPPDEPELPLLDELAPPDEELLLLLEEELLEDPELLELLEPPEDDELVDELELLELEGEDVLEPLLEDPPPHPARTAASSNAPKGAVLENLEPEHAQQLAASVLPFSESAITDVDMVRAPVKTQCLCPKRRSWPLIAPAWGLGCCRFHTRATAVLSPSQSWGNSTFL
jgi:hypothetical protein